MGGCKNGRWRAITRNYKIKSTSSRKSEFNEIKN